jgi:lipoprotein-anchoring transpeptidase ErfK/SrfK
MSAEGLRRIVVSAGRQRLWLWSGGRSLAEYPVSTGRNGLGEDLGSGCTPRGLHRIRLKIGAGCPAGAVFVGRRFTGEIYSPELAAAFPQRDWILSRILWLTGAEQGRNRGGCRDTLRRYIYIHGAPDTEPMGEPLSHGCIRMANSELIDLFDRVAVGDTVLIEA